MKNNESGVGVRLLPGSVSVSDAQCDTGLPSDPISVDTACVPAAGQLVTPDICLDRILRRGGMGSLWLAEHRQLKIPVVVKFIASELLGNGDILARFQREAAATMAAKSPHVVKILDYRFTGHVPFLVMEYLAGEDLAAKLDREGSIPPWEFAEILKQACAGLTAAHAQGIVHRDIKPENIFLNNPAGQLTVKVLDFGIAKSENALFGLGATNTGAFMGTVEYMSPEQTMGVKSVDHRTDLWALGVVTYLALTGIRPFDAEAIGTLVEHITTRPVTPPSQHVPALGSAIDRWMLQALARDPEQRFESADEMAASFNAAVIQAMVWPALVAGGRLDTEGSNANRQHTLAGAGEANDGTMPSSSVQSRRGYLKMGALVRLLGAPMKPKGHSIGIRIVAVCLLITLAVASSVFLSFRAATTPPKVNLPALGSSRATVPSPPAAATEVLAPASLALPEVAGSSTAESGSATPDQVRAEPRKKRDPKAKRAASRDDNPFDGSY